MKINRRKPSEDPDAGEDDAHPDRQAAEVEAQEPPHGKLPSVREQLEQWPRAKESKVNAGTTSIRIRGPKKKPSGPT